METSVIKTICPPDSQVRSFLPKSDFEDAFAFKIPVSQQGIDEVYLKIFNTTPQWVMAAMRLRNLIVSPFGLKTEMDKNLPKRLIPGQKFGIFKIYKISENEVISGDNDRHLNFRVSVHRSERDLSIITVSTIVHYNNLFGKIYMTIVAPFHKLVVKSMIKSSIPRFY